MAVGRDLAVPDLRLLVAGLALPVGADLVVTDPGSGALGLGMAAFGAGGIVGGAFAIQPTPPGRSPGWIRWALFALYPIVPALQPGVIKLAWAGASPASGSPYGP